MHFKVSKVVAIIFKNCFFAFCNTPRDKHHLKFWFVVFPYRFLILDCTLVLFCIFFRLVSVFGFQKRTTKFSLTLPAWSRTSMENCSILLLFSSKNLSYQRLYLSKSQSRERSHWSPWWHTRLNLDQKMHARSVSRLGDGLITKQAQKGGKRLKCWVVNVRTCIRKQEPFTKSYKSRQGNGDAYVEIQAGELMGAFLRRKAFLLLTRSTPAGCCRRKPRVLE